MNDTDWETRSQETELKHTEQNISLADARQIKMIWC